MTLLHFPLNNVNVPVGSLSPTNLSISCGDCTMAGSSACDDCVVTLLCDDPVNLHHGDSRQVNLSVDEAAIIDLFANVGLSPRSRHRGKALAG